MFTLKTGLNLAPFGSGDKGAQLREEIGFGAALEHPRFAASGAQGQEKVGGAEDEQGLQGVLARAGPALGGDGVLPVPHRVQGAFEADFQISFPKFIS